MNWAVGAGDLALVVADYSVDSPEPHCEGHSKAQGLIMAGFCVFVLLKSIAKANGLIISKKESDNEKEPSAGCRNTTQAVINLL